MTTKTIYIGKNFHTAPFGRYEEDGDFSGQAFRQKIIVPELRKYDHLIINLDDVQKGYEFSSSFLHEAFGGLVLEEGFTSEELVRKISIECELPDIKNEIFDYINAPEEYR